MRIYLLIIILFSFWTTIACDNKADSNAGGDTNTDTNTEVVDTKEENEPTAIVDENRINIPTFSIQFDMTPEVKQLLEEKGEEMIVDVSIMGEPIDATKVQGKEYFNEEEQQIYLVQQGIPYSGKGEMTIDNLKADKEAYDALVEKNYEVIIMLYTNRKTAEKNLIDAQTFVMPIDKLQGTTQTIKVEML